MKTEIAKAGRALNRLCQPQWHDTAKDQLLTDPSGAFQPLRLDGSTKIITTQVKV